MKLSVSSARPHCCSRASAAAQDGGKVIPKTVICLGTATPGGGFPVYGDAFAEVMNAADPTLSIEPATPRGATGTFRCSRRQAWMSRWWPRAVL